MRGGDKWNVNVKYMDYASDDDYSKADEKTAPGTFTFLSIPGDNGEYYDNTKTGTLTLTNKPGKNYVSKVWKPTPENSNIFIPDQDGVDVYMGLENLWSPPKMTDKKILSFEKID